MRSASHDATASRTATAPRARLRISRETARRFLLGRQGLWPGRRWHGLDGTAAAMRTMGDLQLDPLRVVARAQDLALASRVVDYREDDWARLTYERRKFFEWGGWLAVRPIEELPYYRVVMRRSRTWGYVPRMLDEHAPAIEEMRALLRERDEVANRHFAVNERTRVDSYRGRKDSAVALYYLWRLGEAMVVRRTRTFERVYARAEAVAPKRYLAEAPDAEADDYLLLKAVRADGFTKLNAAKYTLHREFSRRDTDAWIDRKIADGDLVEVEVEGLTGRRVALAPEAPVLETLAAGRVPRNWRSAGPTTIDEVTFLSPLDPVIHDREQTRRLWDFDYKWGVYDKVEKRRFGYYDLPILWGDRLVGRADLKLDRVNGHALRVLGLWYEDSALERDPAFAEALDRGMGRLRSIVVEVDPAGDGSSGNRSSGATS